MSDRALACRAAVALTFSVPVLLATPAASGCIDEPPVATCTGVLSSGVNYNPTNLIVLNVNNLTQLITPSAGVPGIDFEKQGGHAGTSMTLNFSGGAHRIETTGDNAEGIRVYSRSDNGGGGDDIAGDTDGGNGRAGRTLAIDAVGVITTVGAGSHGIFAYARAGSGGGGGVSAGNGGDGGDGGLGGNITVTGSGRITTSGIAASGIFALSQGGFGGNGGGGLGSGGSGGLGGAGGPVNVSGSWDITTSGRGSHGIAAYSFGGSGGSGGGGVFVGGGSGGTTAVSGDVTVASGGTIATSGYRAYGIIAQSVAGHAGDGGSGNVFVNFSADGGSAGGGGVVTVKNDGIITTTGQAAHAVVAQSIGGGGGSGGGGFGLFYSGGSSGKAGGNGGKVEVTNKGTLRTSGSNATGIFAQSVGGTGGDGGSASGLVSLGGDGATTSDGGTVIVWNSGNIATGRPGAIGTVDLDNPPPCAIGCSHGIFAQSIGGGGGNGGSSGGWFSVGGSAGGGGDGKAVTVNNKGSITTRIAESSGIFAQSIGGGGGNGGSAGSIGANLSIAVGGSGGNGGTGDSVSIGSTSGVAISTLGLRSHGIAGQSIGGGGGNGGFAVSLAAGTGASLSIAVGGKGGDGGAGGAVNITTIDPDYTGTARNTISTAGDGSHGIFAQSVGGGGGNGGFAVSVSGTDKGFTAALAIGGPGGGGGNGGIVSVRSDADITTGSGIETDADAKDAGNGSYGILAQSIGGGGGNGGFAVSAATTVLEGFSASLSFGGGAGLGGTGSDVTVDNSGDIMTRGFESHAIVAQSIGGGGGAGGFSVSGTVTSGAGTSFGASVALGGDGGSGGNAGQVNLTNSGEIETLRRFSFGLLAQSVGGGGGTGGFSGTLTANILGGKSLGLGISLGGKGGEGSDGARVKVENSGSITTRGDDSHGLVAQSIGGGGGNGGFAVAGSFSGPDSGPNGALNPKLAIGGSGGNGGKGDKAIVDNTGPITTYGRNSIALLAQSIGGGGGNGGMSITGGIGLGLNNTDMGVSIGGKGGAGGTADKVTVDSAGRISTEGDQSSGIVAQSIGGSGGNGGMSISGSLSPTTSNSLGVTIGGKGGSGNTASTVTVTAGGIISTTGDEAHGILAQSIGGGGGNGGLAVSGAASGGGQSRSIQVAVGGNGGTGANAGKVVIDNSANITVTGRRSNAILAQSIGGGGGNGGLSAAVTLGSTDAQTIDVSIGGEGAVAGNAGTVKVTNSGTILTGTLQNGEVAPGEEELFAHGIVAQSIGGGGGNGGMAVAGSYAAGGADATVQVNLAIGGKGGGGGTGAKVDVDNSGDITTRSAESFAILAQSIGGGGGSGAAGYAGTFTSAALADGRVVSASIAIGGEGGSGNTASDVSVKNSGVIETHGIGSHAIVAESIGGGGGRGGSAHAITFNSKVGTPDGQNTDKNNYSFSLAIGGNGGSGNHAGKVTVRNTGAIHTREADAVGIFAQSVGGGGGSGGSAAHGLPVPTPGVDKVKMYKNLKIVVGGKGGASGNGGDVLVDHSSGSITTDGAGSAGIFAQSVGGGGGTGGAGTIGLLGTVGVGGGGGAAGRGGTVDVSVAGDITTFGTAAYGIIAQSVGGGGGIAGNVDFGIVDGAPLGIPVKNVGIGLGIGQDGGSSGHGGLVNVDSTGNIRTFGAGSIGIFAQSVGGGGGLAGDMGHGAACVIGDCRAFAGSAGGNGSGGEIKIAHKGIITTTGEYAHGIFAQSAGGEQDALDLGFAYTQEVRNSFADLQDRGGNITIVVDGGVIVSGTGAHGIFAHTEGEDANGSIKVTLKAGGEVQGGAGSGVGVRFQAGAENLLTNHGAISAAGGVSGMAVFGDIGDETIDSFGYLLGSIDLGDGVNRLQNNAGALFDMGAKLALGAGNDLVNDGVLSPGGENNLLTSQVTGNMQLNSTSTYLLDLDLQPNLTDRINVSGETTAGGFTEVAINNPGYATPGSYEQVIIQSDQGVIQNGLALITLPSAVITYGLHYPNRNDVVLGWDIDFAPADLNRNQTSIGEYVNRLQTAGGTDGFRPIAALLFGLPDAPSLAKAYDLMSPEPYLVNEIGTLFSNLRFADSLLSCRARDGEFKFNSEDQCGWFRLTGYTLSRDSSREYFQFSETSYGMAGGIQSAISGRVHLGFGAAFERIEADAYANTSTRGERAQAGVTVKGSFGPITLTNAFTGGYAWFDTDRTIGIPAASVKATADSSIGFVSNHVRASYTFGSKNAYFRPLIDVGITYLHFAGFDETGGGPLSLEVRSHDDVYGTVSPAIELGGELGLKDRTLLRPFARLGLTHFVGDTTPDIGASLASGLDTVRPFWVSTDIGTTFADTAVGLDLLTPGGATLRFSANGQFSKETESYGGSIKFSVSY